MKKTLIVLCSAMALVVGCERDTGAPGTDSDTGYGSGQDSSTRDSMRGTNAWNRGTSSTLTNTNSAIGAPGLQGSGTQSGTGQSGTGQPGTGQSGTDNTR